MVLLNVPSEVEKFTSQNQDRKLRASDFGNIVRESSCTRVKLALEKTDSFIQFNCADFFFYHQETKVTQRCVLCFQCSPIFTLFIALSPMSTLPGTSFSVFTICPLANSCFFFLSVFILKGRRPTHVKAPHV